VDGFAARVFHVEVRDLEPCDGSQCRGQRLVGSVVGAGLSQVLPDVSQSPKHARSIESLTLTVFAEVCHAACTSNGVRPPLDDKPARRR
jgi:hypothetical protein